VWLTPHPRDLIQPEGERERESHKSLTKVNSGKHDIQGVDNGEAEGL